MSNEENDKLIEGHEYDGIQELDNPLPNWWLYTFLATIIFGFFYYLHYEVARDGLSSDEVLAVNLAKIQQKREVSAKQAAVNSVEVNIEDILKDSGKIAEGKKYFGQYCASCHGPVGQGVIGPNLTDDYWIYSSGDYDGVMKALVEGFPQKGMPAWGALIPKEQQPLIVAYVLTTRGSNPPNGKAPQGDKK